MFLKSAKYVFKSQLHYNKENPGQAMLTYQPHKLMAYFQVNRFHFALNDIYTDT